MLVVVAPVFASLIFVREATALTGTPTGSLATYLAWWFGLSIAATALVSVLYTLLRRLLPLGALLELALAFPGEAPSRFRLALRTGTVEELATRLRESDGDPQEAAEILLQLVAALDVHDRITRGHAERVRGYSQALGRELGLSPDELDLLNWSALLHDIGKLEVSEAILNKPGKPTDDEWEQLRSHPLFGEKLVAPLRSWLGEWADAVGYHHEHWDGGGYPRGIAGEAIPLAGRIVAIADVYDVITSARSYKEPATPEEARAELARCSGAQFDPRLVRAFVGISLGRMRVVMGPLSWLTHAPFLARFPLTPSVGAALGGISALTVAAATGLALPHTNADAAPSPAAAPQAPAVRTQAVSTPAARRALVVASHRRHAPSSRAQMHGAHPHRAPADAPRTGPTPVTVPPVAPTRTATAPTAPPGTETTTPAPTTSTTSKTTPTTAPPPTPSTTTTTTTTGTTPTAPAPTTTSSTSPPPPAPAPVNVAPSFAAGGNQTVLEDAGTTLTTGWATSISAGPSRESGQTVQFTVVSDAPSLFSAGPAVAPDGTLTFTPAPNANGVANVTVAAHDDGGTQGGGADTSAPQSFTITVVAVNDAPSFSPGSNLTAVALLGAQTVTGWASAISPGPPNEAAQSVTFNVSVDKPGLFSVAPAIAPDGTLTYKPTALALGTATVTVRVVDDGGTANGGVNTSAARTFTITLL